MNSRLTLQDLADLLADYTDKDKKATERFLKDFIAVVTEGVYTDKIVKVKSLGTFKIVLVDKRESIHVNTGERFVIPAHYKFSFLPDKELKELVNKPFSFFETTEINENVDFSDLDESVDEGKEIESEDESVEDLEPPVEVALEPDSTQEVSYVHESTMISAPISEPVSVDAPAPVETPTIDIAHSPSVSEIKESKPSVSYVEESEKQVERQNFSKEPMSFRKVIFSLCALFVITFMSLYIYVSKDCVKAFLSGKVVMLVDSLPADESVKLPSHEAVPNVAEDTIAEVAATLPVDTVSFREDTVVSAKKEVLDTITIRQGDRLTLIARKYYGHKLFWVYIYDYNKDKISNPNNVPIGTKIEIPEAFVYGIDVNNRLSLEKASVKQTEILTQNK